MAGFVDVKNMVRWVARTGPEKILSEMTTHLEADFRRWEQFDKSPRVASHTPFGVIELMPTADYETYGFKYVNGHPGNPARGFQTVTAFGVLADVHNGYPTFLAEMTVLTALRTAATTAMATRALARPGARRMAMIGAGSQAEFQALAVRSATGITELSVYDVDPAAVAKLVRNLRPLGFTVAEAGSAAEAVEGADVVTTCIAEKAHTQVLRAADLHPGMHVNAIGGDCPGKTELEPAALSLADVFVEYTPQTRIEGEIQLQDPEFPVTELWQAVAGKAEGRRAGAAGEEQITIFDSVGFAIEDFSALTYLREAVRGTDFVTEIDLVAAPEDPKDLFGLCGAPVPVG